MTRLPSANGLHCFNMVGGLGYLNYTNDAKFGNTIRNLKGSTLGVALNVNYDIGLSESFKINLKLSYVSGVVSKLDIDDGFSTTTIDLEEQFGEAENLGRLNIMAGLSLLL